jgi:hypothetical protein
VLVEEAAALEEAEHAALQGALEAVHVVAREVRRLVEGDATVVALGEDAFEDDDVEVEVGVEGRADGQDPDGAVTGEAGEWWGRSRSGAKRQGSPNSESGVAPTRLPVTV